ncbi:AraC family transcriptional regulator [Devosia pacifica]|uniref:AraC family transcriptional regulator n=1 Tax=Devosia pacifica TaxID=1335967 RepID=A0A918SCH5_9HYPH|nr:helix-turn-helix domain-containing protein [Devosia pacifica]GHA34411.1 AraC family transcriptional regulator [Devosia pacifica]
MEVNKQASSTTKVPGSQAPRPMPRPDRSFYASSRAFGRFGIRSFRPIVMSEPHSHGHIEINWLSAGEMHYVYDGRPVCVPSERLVAFWAGIPHQTVALSPTAQQGRQLNVYLPLDSFLHMPQLGRLTETMMGGGIVALNPDAVGIDTLERWHSDYRSGNALRTDIVQVEMGAMFRRAALTGWEMLLPAWIESEGRRTRSASPVRYVVAMVRYVIENISEPLPAAEVAKVVGLHPNYAADLFSKVMRISIQKFVTRMRLIRARALLFEGNLSIANVAFQSGFTSLTQFYEHFRRAYGITPSQMRQDVIDD